MGNCKGLILIALLLISIGCGQQKNNIQDKEFRPNFNIRDSFGVITQTPSPNLNSLKVDKAKISIQKAALEKEFLIQVQLIMQQLAPQFHGLQSRIVSFRRNDNKLYLIETSQGHNASNNSTQTLVLADYPILKEDGETITFDFNEGMSRLLLQGDWRSRDSGSPSPDTVYEAAKVRFSYIESAVFSQNNSLVVNQTAQVETPGQSSNVESPIQIKYYLSPYLANPTFTPTKGVANYDRMAFFEVAPQFNGLGGTVIYSSKLDVSKTVTYAISANTPADFKEAVKDGILYWNKAFGKEVIKVVEAPQGVQAPDSNYNMVQWVEWESAGFAYADAQMDPRSGEILHQQVYFTSSWSQIAKRITQSFLKKDLVKSKAPKFRLAGFDESSMCDLNFDDVARNVLSTDIAKEKDKGKLLKVAQDLVRTIVAHEVGHTLGLRHNFAGSLAANYQLKNRDEIIRGYLSSGDAPENLVTSSSVMDYQIVPEAMMNGDQIKKSKKAGDYDTKAIQSLYFGAKYKDSELPLFCTDSHTGFYLDCKRFDAGASNVEWLKFIHIYSLANLPQRLLESYIDAKAPLFGREPTPVRNVELPSANELASDLLDGEGDFMDLFTEGGKLLKISRTFDVEDENSKKEIKNKLVDFEVNELSQNGGFETVFLNTDPTLAPYLTHKFEALLGDVSNIKGVGGEGQPYEFTPEEISLMNERAKAFFSNLQSELILQEVSLLSGEKPQSQMSMMAIMMSGPQASTDFEKSKLTESFATYLAKKEKQYLTEAVGEPQVIEKSMTDWTDAKSGEALTASRGEKISVKLHHFAYSFEVRKKAATFLRAGRAKYLGWAMDERSEVKSAYEKMLGEAGATPAFQPKVSTDGLPKPLAYWLLEQSTLKGMLD